MKAEQLVQLIRNRYEAKNSVYNQCVVLEQVPDGTGMSVGRWIDVAVFQMWESKGLTRSAFEVKVSRQDFLHELQHPLKHQWCHDNFHEFWFVAPKDVIQIEELPTKAGWMYPRGKGLAIARNAVRNRNPRLDDQLLAAFMRAAYKEIKSASKVEVETILAKDRYYQDAKIISQAVDRFLEKRGVRVYLSDLSDIEVVVGALEQATLDKELIQDREHLLYLLQRFQANIQGLFTNFAVIAKRALLEKEETGKYIVERFGGNDEMALETLKRKKNGKLNFHDKHFADVLETILSWNKEFPSK